MPLTFLSHQAHLAQVLLDENEEEQAQLQDSMILLSTRYHGDEVVSIADPRGLYVHAEPLLRPSEANPPSGDAEGEENQQQLFTGLAFEGSASQYSYEVEMAEFSPELGCYSTFFPVGRMHNGFVRLKLPRHADHELRGAVPSSARCMFRLRSRVDAVDAPGGCVRSLWSPIIGWRAPTPPPPVSDLDAHAVDDTPNILVIFSYPTAPFHNQLVYECLLRESDTAQIPSGEQVGVVQTITPALNSPVMLGPLRINRFYHVCVRAVTSFGRSTWSRWHSVRIGGALATPTAPAQRHISGLPHRQHHTVRRAAATPTGPFTKLFNASAEDIAPAPEENHAVMTSSDWDSEMAWMYPFPQSRASDGFPCPVDSACHFSSDVAERQERRAEAVGNRSARIDAFPTFVAAGYIRKDAATFEGETLVNPLQLYQGAAGVSPTEGELDSPPVGRELLTGDNMLPFGGIPVPPVFSNRALEHVSPGEGRRRTKVTLVMGNEETSDTPPLPRIESDTVQPPKSDDGAADAEDAANLSLNSSASDLVSTAKPSSLAEAAAVGSSLALAQSRGGRTLQQFMRDFLPTPPSPVSPDTLCSMAHPCKPPGTARTSSARRGTTPPSRRSIETTVDPYTQRRSSRGEEYLVTPADRIFCGPEDPLAALRFANNSIIAQPRGGTRLDPRKPTAPSSTSSSVSRKVKQRQR